MPTSAQPCANVLLELKDGTHRQLTDYSANRADLALDEAYVYWLWPGYVYRASIQELEAMPEGVIPRGRPMLTE